MDSSRPRGHGIPRWTLMQEHHSTSTCANRIARVVRIQGRERRHPLIFPSKSKSGLRKLMLSGW
jgi:hypothetical protein